MTRDPSRRDDAQRIVDGLADLFDRLPPADRAAAEEELREAGTDPAAVGRRLAARAAAHLPERAQPTGVVRELEPRAPHVVQPRMGVRLMRIAAVLALGVGIGWWASRTSPSAEQLVQRVPVPGRAPTLPARADTGATPLAELPTDGDVPAPADGSGQPAMASAPPVSGIAGRDALAAPYDPGPAYDASDDELVGAVGDSWILDVNSWQRANQLLPAPVVEQVRRGKSRFRVIAVDTKQLSRTLPGNVRRANEWIADVFDLADDCGLLNRRTRRPPASYFGLPFPKIQLDAPQAGCQIMWNVEAAGAVAGGRLTLEDIDASGIDAGSTRLETEALAFLGRHSGPIENPGALRSASLRSQMGGGSGLVQLTRRPIGSEPDGNWIYVASHRRVRALTNSVAADSALGGGLSRDDRECFDGRLETFDWQVIDETTALAPLIAARPLQQRALLPTRAQVDLPNLQPPEDEPGSGSMTGELPLTERPVWIVEGTARDPHAEAARIVLYIDRELYRPYWKIAYRPNGELANYLLCAQYWSVSEDRLTTPGTGLLARIDPSRGAVIARRRREVLDQGLRDDWFSVRSMIESAGSR